MGKKLTHEEFINKYYNKYPNSNIKIVGDYKKSSIPIECCCLVHNYTWIITPNNLLRGERCPICTNKKVIKGINDLATTHPDLTMYFKNKSDCYMYTFGSDVKVDLICPDCGSEKRMIINHLVHRGFVCDICGDKSFSYPNRFAHAFFAQLPINRYESEYSPDWIKPKRYDNYFEYKGKSYIVEMDGEFHYKDAFGKKYNSIQEVDLYKDEMAIKHNIKVIRIECLISSPNYIKDKIINSELSEIFDLTNFDWDKCYKNIYLSSYMPIWEYANRHINTPLSVIGERFGKSPTQMQSIIRHGQEAMLCFYEAKPFNSKSIIIMLDGKIIDSFPSINKARKYLYEIYNIEISHQTISKACNNEKSYKGFTFKYAD